MKRHHTQNNNDLRSEFPVKDIFSIRVQTIRKSTWEKGSQYHNIMIKNKLTQTIDGPQLFVRSVSTQTLPIPCTCVDFKKKMINLQDQVSHIWLQFFISCDNAYTHESTSSFYFKKFRNNVTLLWEFGKSELCKQNSLNKVFIYR